MIIESFFHEDTATFTHVIVDKKNKTCAIIDPVQDFDSVTGRTSMHSTQKLLDWINTQELCVKWVLETHVHADHLTSAYYIKEKTGALIGIGSGIIEVLKYWVPFYNNEENTPMDGSQFDRLFQEGDVIQLGDLSIQVLTTPGHTPACVSYYVNDAIFVGDTIFMPYMGTSRTDFPGGSAAQLYDSIQKILKLPETTRIFTCHDYPPQGLSPTAVSTVGEQRISNLLINDKISREEYINKRTERDKQLSLPKLLLPSIQVNMRCGQLGPKNRQGVQMIKIPLNRLQNAQCLTIKINNYTIDLRFLIAVGFNFD